MSVAPQQSYEELLEQVVQYEKDLSTTVATLQRFKTNNMELKRMHEDLKSEYTIVVQQLENIKKQLEYEAETQTLKEEERKELIEHWRKQLSLQAEQFEKLQKEAGHSVDVEVLRLKISEEVEAIWAEKVKNVEEELREETKKNSILKSKHDIVAEKLASLELEVGNKENALARKFREEIESKNQDCFLLQTKQQNLQTEVDKIPILKRELQQARLQAETATHELAMNDKRIEQLTNDIEQQLSDFKKQLDSRDAELSHLKSSKEALHHTVAVLQQELMEAQQKNESSQRLRNEQEIAAEDRYHELYRRHEEAMASHDQQLQEMQTSMQKVKSQYSTETSNLKLDIEKLQFQLRSSEESRLSKEKDLHQKVHSYQQDLNTATAALEELKMTSSQKINKLERDLKTHDDLSLKKTHELEACLQTANVEHAEATVKLNAACQKADDLERSVELYQRQYSSLEKDYKDLQGKHQKLQESVNSVLHEKDAAQKQVAEIQTKLVNAMKALELNQEEHKAEVERINKEAEVQSQKFHVQALNSDKLLCAKEKELSKVKLEMKRLADKCQKKFKDLKNKCHMLIEKCQQLQNEKQSIMDTYVLNQESDRLQAGQDSQAIVNFNKVVNLDHLLHPTNTNALVQNYLAPCDQDDTLRDIQARLKDQAAKYGLVSHKEISKYGLDLHCKAHDRSLSPSIR